MNETKHDMILARFRLSSVGIRAGHSCVTTKGRGLQESF